MERKSIYAITHNSQLKKYPDGSAVMLIASKPIFREPGWEEVGKKPAERSEPKSEKSRELENLERSRRRAKAMVSDYARCNDFCYFVTLTMDKAMVDRYDITGINKKLRSYLDNAVRRDGLKYVLIPEYHSDGAIHFHGLINKAVELVDSGTIKLPNSKKPRKPRSKVQRVEWLENGGQVVYNIPGYTLGFSTAIELYGDYSRAIGYVCKYIGKGKQKIGGRWYYSGGNLRTPDKEYFDTDFDSCRVGEHSFTIPRLGVEVVKLEVDANGTRGIMADS